MITFFKKKIWFYRRFIIYKFNAVHKFFYIQKARTKLKNKDFTIISNNCWGGSIYEDLGLNYTTPTVGLFFFAPCYIKFLSNLKNNLSASVQFISQSKYTKGNYLQTLNRYPIGLINGDIEIHFFNYHSEEEILEKWQEEQFWN